jgi:hypothetical protein
MRFVLAVALALALAAGAAAQPTPEPLFQFGRTGGNIEPYTVTINRDGTLDSSGFVRLAKPDTHLSQARLASLLRYARTQRFWTLPKRRICKGSLPDFAAQYVTIHTVSKTRTVRVRGSCSVRFTRIYRALSAAATVTP